MEITVITTSDEYDGDMVIIGAAVTPAQLRYQLNEYVSCMRDPAFRLVWSDLGGKYAHVQLVTVSGKSKTINFGLHRFEVPDG